MDIEKLQNLSDAEKAKIFAACHALGEVKSGMKIGIGTGSTAAWFVHLLAYEKADGLRIRACATSSATTELAESLGIKIESLDELAPLDLVIDGTDEFDSEHNLIKGGGGALLQEKIVAQSAKRFIVITDVSKQVKTLGKFPLPIEVVRFGWQATEMQIRRNLRGGVIKYNPKGVQITRRMVDNKPFITDEGHYILDLHLNSIDDPELLETILCRTAGVVETGLFLDMANDIVMADSLGFVKSRETGGKWEEKRYDWGEASFRLIEVEE